MSKLRTVEQIVRPILQKNPDARNDDMILYLMVCKDCVEEKRKQSPISLDEVMLDYRALNIPCFESVRRVRQKIQAADPMLGCSPSVRRARNISQKKYRRYALDND